MKLITVNYNCFKLLYHVTTTNMLDEYADIFDGRLGTLPGKVHLHVKEGAKPVQCPARRVPVILKPKLKAELDTMGERESSVPLRSRLSGAIKFQFRRRGVHRCEVLQRELYPLPTM